MQLKWDPHKYTTDFAFVTAYGQPLLDLLALKSDQIILDLGCGNGNLTADIAKQVKKVIGLDASEEFITLCRQNYPDLEFLLADATDFELSETVDGVFSNAVLHWIPEEKQNSAIKNIYNSLKADGLFVFEMGGYGNNALIHAALEEAFTEQNLIYQMPFYFPSISEYAFKLESNRFLVTDAFLFERPTFLAGENGMADWINMFIKTPWHNVAPEQKHTIIDAAVAKLRDKLYDNGNWYADYVRLRIKAKKISN